MTNVIKFSRPHEVDLDFYAPDISGSIFGNTEGESDVPLEIYVARFFGSEHFTDGAVHLAVGQPNSNSPACAITLTPAQARDLALYLLKS